MPQWEGKSKGTPLGYQIFVFVIKHLGVRAAYSLLLFVAAYYFVFSWTSSRHIIAYFRLRQHYSYPRALRKLYTNYYKFGQTIIDKVVVMAGLGGQFTYHFDGEENLHEIVRRGKGGILMSGHVGNWEVAGHLLKRLDTRVNVVMYEAEHEKIKAYLDEVTGGRNFNVIPIRNDLSHVYAIGEALQKNELICLHADRFVEGNKTVTRNFLGAPARFPVGVFSLAATFKVPVSIVFAFKETATHYHFFGSPLIVPDNNMDRKQAVDNLIDNFVLALQEKVRQYPEQWFNYYNFWKH